MRLAKFTLLWVVILFLGQALPDLVFAGRIFPGVEVAGIKIGGLDYARAKTALNRDLNLTEIRLVWGGSRWTVNLQEIGLEYDAEQTALRAMELGRSGGWAAKWRARLAAWKSGVEILPVFTLEENLLAGVAANIAAEVNVPAVEPEITIETKGREKTILVTEGENGQEVDEGKLMAKIKRAVQQRFEGEVEVPVVNLTPKLRDEEIEAVSLRARKFIDQKILVRHEPLDLIWTVDENEIVSWIDRDGWQEREIETWGLQLAQSVDRPAQNAVLKFVRPGRVDEFSPGKDGYQVKQAELVEKMLLTLARLESGQENPGVSLPVQVVAPDVGTGDANLLGIKELVGRGESWFSGSITNRIFNLKKAAAEINGTLVAPGDVFSFNDTTGEISAATGYKQAYIIKEGKTILGDGGGVCQVSSTLFRAVLAAGLSISERTAHAYRVSYYEEKYQPGFDATVFQPAPDFRFVNDTPGYILIQTELDEKAKHLVFNIYGTSDGRKTEISKARVWDQTPPPPDLYQDDPTLPVGKVVQTEHAAWGAKVAFDWKVTRGEEVLQERTFYSSYRPWQAVYLRGTKTN